MLRIIGFMIKLVAFAALVLVIGNWARWDGKTLSDQVKEGVAKAERSEAASKMRDWTRSLTDDAREGAERKAKRRAAPPAHASERATDADRTGSEAAAPARAEERIPSSERQKLRDLIRELNSPRN